MNEMQQKLVEDNIGLVHYLHQKNYPNKYDEDAISEGIVGLCKAATSFDDKLGISFSTYAGKCILNEIRSYYKRSKRHYGIASLDYVVDEGDFNSTVADTIEDESARIDLVNLDFKDFYDDLEAMDKKLLQLASNYSNEIIAEKLNKSEAWVAQRLRKLRRDWGIKNGDIN